MKRVNLILSIVLALFVFTNISMAQKVKRTTKLKQTYFTISPSAGIIFPVGAFGDNVKTGLSAGLDLSYRINKEVGFYGKFGYNNLNSKTEDAGIPSTRIYEFTAGPRYYMTNPKLSSTLFLEGGVGGYSITQDAYSIGGIPFVAVSETKLGVNAGIGANLAVSNAIDILLKTKYHNVFADGGTNSFITALAGLEFKIR